MSVDPSTEEKWRKMLTEGEPINRHVYHLFGLLPSNPRCKLCAAPFKSWGGALMRLIGREQSEYNPRFCQPCEQCGPPRRRARRGCRRAARNQPRRASPSRALPNK